MREETSMTERNLDRREALRRLAAAAAGLAAPLPLVGCAEADPAAEPSGPATGAAEPAAARFPGQPDDEERLHAWIAVLVDEGLTGASVPLGLAAVRVGELAAGTPYEAFTLEEYIRAGGSPVRAEPLTLSLTRFDCVSLVEACLAIARIARDREPPTWERFALAMEAMRYRGGERSGYSSRLHYFSEWLQDGADRGLVTLLGEELGGLPDRRPLRFMSSNVDAYPALAYPEVLAEIVEMERALDGMTRWVVPTAAIPEVEESLESGDVLAFATSIEGLDVTHAAFAYRDEGGVMRVLHAPLSGGVVDVTEATLPQYVAAIRQSTGILVGRPLDG